ncbi:MAG: phosphoribosylanthranilate isomerase [Chloroflexota bacterium]|nr:phosphoribosylanthranilate isomerase [Chloroflexota bacterium]
MTRVKVCGIAEPAHALAAADAGVDFVGVVFAPSPRRVTVERAREIALALERLTAPPQLVGVFVNAPAGEVNRVVEHCRLDWVQLSGDEPWDYVRTIRAQVIKAIRVRPGQDSAEIAAMIEAGLTPGAPDFLCLLDCHVEGSYGGSGRVFDWAVAREVGRRYPVIVAGGLTPDNVGEAIGMAQPWGVDVSSGVESDGVKDVSRIRAFVAAVRAKNGT